MNKSIRFGILILSVLMALIVSGCEMPASTAKTNVWIDVPVDGISVAEGTLLHIEGHATGQGGVGRVEVWINGVMQFEMRDLPMQDDLARFSQEWMPPGAGEYTIQVLAVSGDGSASEPDHARVQVGVPIAEVQSAPDQESAGEEKPPTPTETPTPTPTPPPSAPEVVIEFWADPGEINAGGKFTVHWHAENVRKVIFGGIEQPFDGEYSDYLCKNQRYTLTVIHNDGREEKRSVVIRVKGDCITPEPESSNSESSGSDGNSSSGDSGGSSSSGEDTTAPPAPNQLKPLNGADLGCIASLMLRWEAVSDESGITEYQVEVQRHPGDNKWQAAPGSMFTGIGGLQKELGVECGWEYRWRVRAVDGAGNPGSWSGWFTFVVPIT